MKCRPGRDGSVSLTLEAPELQLLREIPDQLRLLYAADDDDPARSRLFPRAYLDPTEESAEQEWRAVVHPELLRERLEGLDRVIAALDRCEVKGRRARVDLVPDEVHAWVQVLNDARLAFGSRLGVTDETNIHRFPPDDPLAPEKAAYAWLTMLQDTLVETLLGSLPD